MADPYGARLLKRVVQANGDFAHELQQRVSGGLLKWAKAGGGWVVLALLERVLPPAEADGGAREAEQHDARDARAEARVPDRRHHHDHGRRSAADASKQRHTRRGAVLVRC